MGLESKVIELFDGEVIITKGGIYGHVQTYIHPKSQTTVYLMGDMHIGTKGCYSSFKPFIDECKVILHEGMQESPPKKSMQELLDLFHENPYEGMMCANQMANYNIMMMRCFSGYKSAITKEKKEHPEKWIHVDAGFSKAKSIINKTEKMMRKYHKRLSQEDIQDEFNYFTKLIRFVENNELRLSEIGELLSHQFGEGGLLQELVHTPLAKERDKYLVQQLHYRVKQEDPGCIGAFYGGAHMVGMRRLLEKKKYKHQESISILCIEY